MALDLTNTTPAYLLGRLAAVYHFTEAAVTDRAVTNAQKLLTQYRADPILILPLMEAKSSPYKRRQNPWSITRLDKLVQEIMGKLPEDFSNIRNLDGTMIVGFHHQIQSLYTKKTEGEDSSQSNN